MKPRKPKGSKPAKRATQAQPGAAQSAPTMERKPFMFGPETRAAMEVGLRAFISYIVFQMLNDKVK